MTDVREKKIPRSVRIAKNKKQKINVVTKGLEGNFLTSIPDTNGIVSSALFSVYLVILTCKVNNNKSLKK